MKGHQVRRLRLGNFETLNEKINSSVHVSAATELSRRQAGPEFRGAFGG